MSQRIIGSVVGAIILVFTYYPTPAAATGTNPRNHPPPGWTKAAALTEIGPCQDVSEQPRSTLDVCQEQLSAPDVNQLLKALTSHRSSSITVF